MEKFTWKFITGAAIALIILAAMIPLPHDTYIRWQAVKLEAFARAGWIYERIHDDQTPIDIAFIGTSHTMMGIDAKSFADDLTDMGLRTNEGECLHAVNFAVPSYGRDLHWEIGQELLNNRKVRILVLEVLENETRKAHPLFVYLADTKEIFHAPLLFNINYFHNLIRLPYRQLSLAVKSLAPESFALKAHFDPANYDGSNVDNTRIINVDGAALSPYRDHVMPQDQLEAESKANFAAKHLHMLGAWGEPYEYAVPNHYVSALLDLARQKNVAVVFLYLPQYGMPPHPMDEHLYQGRGDWLFANDILAHPEYWFDEEHLNAPGAAALTQRLAAEFVSKAQSSEAMQHADDIKVETSPKACTDSAYPTRAQLSPFHTSQTGAVSED